MKLFARRVCLACLGLLIVFSQASCGQEASLAEAPSSNSDRQPADKQGADKQDNTGRQSAQQFQREIKLDYLLALPKDYESQDSWPLVLFLHGAGERGSDLNQVKVHGPPKLVEAGKEFPFILVSPQCPRTIEGHNGTERRGWWEPLALTALLDEVVAKHNVDESRIYVTGLSMGGFGTFALAAHTPHRFAAIAPICGGGNPQTCPRIAGIPAWVFHGDQDTVVPLDRSQAMVDGLKAAGNDARFTIYEGAGHDSWTETYENPELYEWFLSQSLDADD